MRGLIKLFRPFTLVAPIVGGVTFSAVALKTHFLDSILLVVLNGFLLACANAVSNILNQIYDREIDADHPSKRFRPIPSGEVSVDSAMSVAYILTILVVAVSFTVFGLVYGVLMSIILVFAWLYSSPPLRLKRVFLLNNLALATPRGGLGIMTAYSAFGNPLSLEILLPAFLFAVYIFGANTLKDFEDIEADRKHGVRTVPVVLGRVYAAAFTFPFLLLPILVLIYFDFMNLANLIPLPTTLLMGYVIASNPGLTGVERLMWRIFYINYALLMVCYAVPRVV
ncbi:MAG: UbiA family prenyltransferase [Nitrososphaerota archaeon]